MSAPTLDYLRPVPGEPKWSLAVTERGVELLRASDRRVLAVWRPRTSRLLFVLSAAVVVAMTALALGASIAVIAGVGFFGSIGQTVGFWSAMSVLAVMVPLLRMLAPAQRVASDDQVFSSFSVGATSITGHRVVRDSKGIVLGRIKWKWLANFRMGENLRCEVRSTSGAKLTLRKLPAASNCFEVTDRRTRAVVAWIGMHPGGATLSLPAQPSNDLDDRLLAALLYSVIWMPEDQD